jgi:hypothetical protein
MITGTAVRAIVAAFLMACPVGATALSAREAPRKSAARAEAQPVNAIMVVRVWKDGNACPKGVARLRPLKGGQLDMSRFVEIGYVTSFDGKPGLQAMGEFFAKGATLNFQGIFADVKNTVSERFVPIASGTYVMTSINCQYGNSKASMGDDHANLFVAETGRAFPIHGANTIDVRAGEILDAGILEIRSDAVGFFETKTASVVAMSTPASEQAELRQALGDAGGKIRFSNFRAAAR